MTKRILILVAVQLAVLAGLMGLFATGCLGEAKAPLNTADEVARYLCGAFHSKKAGISLQEAIDTSCDTLEKIRPFYKPIIAMEKAGLTGSDPEATGVCQPISQAAGADAAAVTDPQTVIILVRPEAGVPSDAAAQ